MPGAEAMIASPTFISRIPVCPNCKNSREAARRLFLAEGFLDGGGSPQAVFKALNLDAAFVDAVEKVYNPAEPRVPAGSGWTSGQ